MKLLISVAANWPMKVIGASRPYAKSNKAARLGNLDFWFSRQIAEVGVRIFARPGIHQSRC
jgi:hypothetical protein